VLRFSHADQCLLFSPSFPSAQIPPRTWTVVFRHFFSLFLHTNWMVRSLPLPGNSRFHPLGFNSQVQPPRVCSVIFHFPLVSSAYGRTSEGTGSSLHFHSQALVLGFTSSSYVWSPSPRASTFFRWAQSPPLFHELFPFSFSLIRLPVTLLSPSWPA